MANMRAIRKRIKSIEGTRQIARSMHMVAAAKLRKTQSQWQLSARFSARCREMLEQMGGVKERACEPLLCPREGQKLCLVLVVGSRGLCGAYNSAVVKAAESLLSALEGEVSLVVCGRWGREQILALGRPVLRFFDSLSDTPTEAEAEELADFLKELYLTGQADRIELLYMSYQSALQQESKRFPLLPMADSGEDTAPELIFEPDAETLLHRLAELTLRSTLRTLLLEARTAEHSARMTAMSAASDNTDEMITKLSLELNRARQAAITTEITEIVSGFNALNEL